MITTTQSDLDQANHSMSTTNIRPRKLISGKTEKILESSENSENQNQNNSNSNSKLLQKSDLFTIRQSAWKNTRKSGYQSFLIPIFSVLLAFVLSTSETQNTFKSFYNSSQAWSLTFIYFKKWFYVEIFLNSFKTGLCCFPSPFGFGMEWSDYLLVIGPRHNWSNNEIKQLENKYGMKKLKIMDAIYRRAGHILVNLTRIWYYVFLINDNQLRLQVAIQHLFIIFPLKFFTEKNIIGNFVYQGCRIRDGQYGRFNQVVVNFWAYSARIIMMTILLNLRDSFTESMYKDILCLAMQPLIWGDTFGEIIGAFFGKREFQVRGIGEINKKTVEGTFAVFVSSILGMILVDQFYINQFYNYIPNSSSNTEDHLQLTYKFNKMLVFGLTSLVCMFFEVMAFRGTDNFFLQLSGLIMLLLMKE